MRDGKKKNKKTKAESRKQTLINRACMRDGKKTKEGRKQKRKVENREERLGCTVHSL